MKLTKRLNWAVVILMMTVLIGGGGTPRPVWAQAALACGRGWLGHDRGWLGGQTVCHHPAWDRRGQPRRHRAGASRVYKENINFQGKNITVGSLFVTTGDEDYILQTVIDGNRQDHVVTFENSETAGQV